MSCRHSRRSSPTCRPFSTLSGFPPVFVGLNPPRPTRCPSPREPRPKPSRRPRRPPPSRSWAPPVAISRRVRALSSVGHGLGGGPRARGRRRRPLPRWEVNGTSYPGDDRLFDPEFDLAGSSVSPGPPRSSAYPARSRDEVGRGTARRGPRLPRGRAAQCSARPSVAPTSPPRGRDIYNQGLVRGSTSTSLDAKVQRGIGGPGSCYQRDR